MVESVGAVESVDAVSVRAELQDDGAVVDEEGGGGGAGVLALAVVILVVAKVPAA